MSQRCAPEPGSDAHVLNLEEMLAEREAQFNRELDTIRATQQRNMESTGIVDDSAHVVDNSKRQYDNSEHPNPSIDEQELQTSQRDLIDQGKAFDLSEEQLYAVRFYVIDKLNVVRAMREKAFSMLDFKELTTEQIFNLGLIALSKPRCLEALADGRTTIEQLGNMDVDSLMEAVDSDNYPMFSMR